MDKTLMIDERVVGQDLAGLLRRAFRIVGEMQDRYDIIFDPLKGLIALLQSCSMKESSAERRYEVDSLVGSFRVYFRRADPSNRHTNNGMILVDVSEDGLRAVMTLIPPRGIGNMPTINMVTEAVEEKRIIFGVDNEVVHQALATMRKNEDIVWGAVMAKGVPAVAPGPRKVKFSAGVLDKAVLKGSQEQAGAVLRQLWEPVSERQRIGFLMDPEPGTPGRDVYGRLLPPPQPQALELGEDVKCSSDGVLTAAAPGYVIADGHRVDVVPLYVISDSSKGLSGDLSFSGAVLVQGNLSGPGMIECDDLFVAGNSEQVRVVSRGDIFVAGGVLGHNNTELAADGSIYCSFVSEAKVSALGEIVVANALINSEAVSSDIIKVVSPKGIIAGGRLYSLRGISAATIGSEFGMLTEVFVGKDFLTVPRLEEIAGKIVLLESNLARIQNLKNELSRSKVSIESLPKDKQEIYIGILRKEQNSRNELKSLLRRRDILQRAFGEFLAASVKVLNNIYPPSRVQILDAISEVKQKLNAVILKWGKQGVVMTDLSDNSQKEVLK